jgi:3-oxoacid CoA-transferase subunit B
MAWTEEQMCRIAARELKDGYYVNLGIGIPTQVANYLDPGIEVIFHSENGILGMGPYPLETEVDPDIINAGKQTVSELPCTCYVDSVMSFAIVRSGHINVTILGGLQVSESADLANWTIPGKLVRGMGGAMDLVAGQTQARVLATFNR